MSPERTASRTSRLLDVLLWTAAVAALALTASFSLERAAPHLQELIGSDKAGHAVAYFAVLLPLLFAAVWRPGRGDGVMPNGQLRLAIGLVAIGALMEVLQATLTTTRAPELLDVVADGVGVGGALVVFHLVRRAYGVGSDLRGPST